ncbi:DUF1232 domain-containing protein [soil metagenome]
MSWRLKARRLKSEVHVLYLAYKDPRVPLRAKLLVALVVGYAFSPIDLIPDFIPVIGYLDDLVLIPLGISLAIRTIPPNVLSDCRDKARTLESEPVSMTAAVGVILIWLLLAAGSIALILQLT